MHEFADSLRLWQQGMHETKKVSGSEQFGGAGRLGIFRGGEAVEEQGGCKRACLLSFFLADAARRFLDKFLVWSAIFAPVVQVRPPRLWQRGIHEVGKVSGSGSRACVNLRKPQALAAGRA